MDKKSIDLELTRALPDFLKCTSADFPFTKYIISQHWNKGGGAQEDAIECFKLFNRRGYEAITQTEIEAGLREHLDYEIKEEDIKALMAELDADESGQVNFNQFKALYNS